MKLVDYISGKIYSEVEVLETYDDLPSCKTFVSSVLDEDSMERYEVYSDEFGMLWAVKEE